MLQYNIILRDINITHYHRYSLQKLNMMCIYFHFHNLSIQLDRLWYY